MLEAVRNTEKIALSIEEDPYLPNPEEPWNNPLEEKIDKNIITFSQEEKAYMINDLKKAFPEQELFGSLITGLTSIVVANSRGLALSYSFTDLHITINIVDGDESYWAQTSTNTLDDLNLDELISSIEAKLLLDVKYGDISPGRYTVILSPIALEEIVSFLGYVGFSAQAEEEGISFLRGKIDEKVFSEKLTIVDDPLRKEGLAMPFDLEGVKKQKLTLVEKGVFRTFAYDKKTALKKNTKSTGHCMGIYQSFPYTTHLEILPGSSGLKDIITETEKGIYVSRFHYVNLLDPHAFTLTGMTRDGTYLIERGKIVGMLPNLRFTQNFLEAFNNIEDISIERRKLGAVHSYEYRLPVETVLPYVKIKDFNFTGISRE
ncbi:MAG TPA: TldD/PmbA family protein [candidate division WOR-3 bacterium]|uniref:TldD/PmbA family protein n=1 Tax=candidate division WOR-3 bacterium TaxID=2052148 RepID=A0A7V5LT86_UNCW3|nr:TldD/PmbA family protein [candidate division WOR-3 bacterium]